MVRKAKAVPEVRDESQKKYLARRDARIEQLFLREGYEPRDIADAMLDDGTLQSDSVESARRVVRSVVAKIRARIDGDRGEDSRPVVATNDIDALERKLRRLRSDLAWQNMVAAGEPNTDGAEATVTTTVDTPNGIITSVRPKWPAGKRVDAKKAASALAEKIAELEIALSTKRALISEAEQHTGDGGLTIIESDKTIPELIRANLIVGTFGKKRGSDGGSGSAANA